MDKEQIKEEFKFFMEKCSKSPGSFRNYLSGFSTVEKYIKDLEPDFTTLLENVDPIYLYSLYERLMQYDKFTEYNSSNRQKVCILMRCYHTLIFCLLDNILRE